MKRLAPQVGFEPTTLRLTAECSTIELLRSKVFLHLTRRRQRVSNRYCTPGAHQPNEGNRAAVCGRAWFFFFPAPDSALSPAESRGLAAALRTEANYFERDAERMRYRKFRKQQIPFGLAPVWSKPAAKSRWGTASSARVCFGPFEEPRPSLRSAAGVIPASLTPMGRTDVFDYSPYTCRVSSASPVCP